MLKFLKEHPTCIKFFSKIVTSTRHVYTYKCGGEPATYRGHLKWQYPVNEPKCSFLFFLFFAGVRGGAGLFRISTFKRIMFSYMYMVACTL